MEMLFCTSLIALVGAADQPQSSPRKLQIVNTKVRWIFDTQVKGDLPMSVTVSELLVDSWTIGKGSSGNQWRRVVDPFVARSTLPICSCLSLITFPAAPIHDLRTALPVIYSCRQT